MISFRMPSPLWMVLSGLAMFIGLGLVWRGPGLASAELSMQARQHLVQGRLDAAQDRAQAALRVDPSSVEALVVLAEAAAARGDTASALALHREAARRSQRAIASHAWLAAHLGGLGEVEQALDHVDSLLRSHVDLREALYPALTNLLESPRGAQALAERLGEAPAWRPAFLRHLGSNAASSEALAGLYAVLDAGPNPPTLQERRALLQRLVGERRYRDAWLMFVATLDDTGLAELGNLFNGGFELDSSGLPFDWQFGRVAGAAIDQVESIDDDGQRSRRLRIEFANRRVPFNHVSQLLVLDPGEYRFEGRVRLEALANARGLQWVVHCAEARSNEVYRGDSLSGTRAWGRFGGTFTVPDQGCSAQWLRLRIPARIDSERQVSGRAWFDDLRIQRVPEPR